MLLLIALTLTLTYPVTTSVAEGAFRAMKGLLPSDCPSMSCDTQIGHLLAMVHSDVNMRFPGWAPLLQSSPLPTCYTP